MIYWLKLQTLKADHTYLKYGSSTFLICSFGNYDDDSNNFPVTYKGLSMSLSIQKNTKPTGAAAVDTDMNRLDI